jgi:hypothetical protein
MLRGKAMSIPSLDPVQSLGYVGLRARDIDDWSGYGTRLLGLQAVDRSRATLALRMDDRKQRLIVTQDGGEGIGFFGWEVADAAALDRLGAHLEAHGVEAARASRALADERHVADLIISRLRSTGAIEKPSEGKRQGFYRLTNEGRRSAETKQTKKYATVEEYDAVPAIAAPGRSP